MNLNILALNPRAVAASIGWPLNVGLLLTDKFLDTPVVLVGRGPVEELSVSSLLLFVEELSSGMSPSASRATSACRSSLIEGVEDNSAISLGRPGRTTDKVNRDEGNKQTKHERNFGIRQDRNLVGAAADRDWRLITHLEVSISWNQHQHHLHLRSHQPLPLQP